MKTDNLVLQALQKSFRKLIPSGTEITARAIVHCLGAFGDNPEWIKANFSRMVEDVQVTAYEEYLEAEQRVGRQAIVDAFLKLAPADVNAVQMLDLVGSNFYALDRFFLGLTQGRRPRAGNAFEQVIRQLFTALEYPFTSQPDIGGSIPDFVIPSISHFEKNPIDCIIFTVKRTLRERWRQIVTEGTRGLGFYLATIDDAVSDRDLAEMVRSRIYLVVPAGLKAKGRYATAVNVISFEHFFQYYLDPGMARWKAGAVI